MAGRLPFLPVRIGGRWRASNEIDVVAIGQEAALLVECKWSTRPVGEDILRDLERKASLLDPELSHRRRLAMTGHTTAPGDPTHPRHLCVLGALCGSKPAFRLRPLYAGRAMCRARTSIRGWLGWQFAKAKDCRMRSSSSSGMPAKHLA